MAKNESAAALAGARGAKVADIDELHAKDTAPPLAALLRSWAGFLDQTAMTLSSGARVSLAGRRCLVHIGDRLREAAEVLRGR
jgi:hypothetical protein